MSRRSVLPLVACAALAVAGCGGGDSSSSAGAATGQQPPPGGGPMGAAFDDPKVAACLKKEGIEVPQGRRNRPPRTGTRPQGPPPEGAQRPRDDGQFEKLRAALKKCGVELPQPGQAPQGQQRPQT